MFRSMLSRRGVIAVALLAALNPKGRFRPAGAAAKSGRVALAEWCANLAPSGAIGEACLRALPAGGASVRLLARQILADLPAASGGASARTLARSLKARSRDDFRDGRIVSVDGWMLSLTEARLYALAMLLARRRPGVG
jgi:hypothetical protein